MPTDARPPKHKRQPSPLGIAIRDLRLERGMSQAELARNASMHQSYISMLESGDRDNASFPYLKLIARALDITPNDLYRRAGIALPVDHEEVTLTVPSEYAVLVDELTRLPKDLVLEALRFARRVYFKGVPPPPSEEEADDADRNVGAEDAPEGRR